MWLMCIGSSVTVEALRSGDVQLGHDREKLVEAAASVTAMHLEGCHCSPLSLRHHLADIVFVGEAVQLTQYTQQ